MNVSPAPLLLVAALAALPAAAASPPTPPTSPSPASEESWARAADGRDVAALLTFLDEYPRSPRVAEARQLLQSKRRQPLGRLVDATPECVTALDSRARMLLRSSHLGPRFANYDVDVPLGHFATHPSVEIFPPEVPPEQVPIEAVLALDLIAERNGACTLQRRWGIGSRLPATCSCVPLDPGFVYTSALAQRVLRSYSESLGAASACKDAGADQTPLVEAFLDEWLAARGRWLEAIRGKQQRKETVYPSEVGEADETEYALPLVRARTVDQPAFALGRSAIGAVAEAQRSDFCKEEVSRRIEQARMRTLLSTMGVH